jgi:hypothetical protein
MTDIRRPKETGWLGRYPRLLNPHRCRAPEAETVVVMVVGIGHKDLLVSDEPGRLTVTESFSGLGKTQADGTERLERIFAHRPDSGRPYVEGIFLLP